jgi:tetratricopeptide (TPR) repeat protein
VPELPGDARIRDLKRRLELDPSSRLFVSLAEEYRKAGRTADALITLQQGLRNHPGYISAQVALGRAYLEAGNVSESIATFTKVLTADPGNLVSAKSLADIFLSRGESVEAIKKYKLYRALSGDRTVDDIVLRLEKEIAPPAPRPSRSAGPATLPAPPTFFEETPAGLAARSSRSVEIPDARPGIARPAVDKFDVTSIKWEESTAGKRARAGSPAGLPLAKPAASDMPTQPFKLDAILAQSPFVDAEAPAPEPFAAWPTPLDEVFSEEAVFPLSAEPLRNPAALPSERPTDRMEPRAQPPAEPAEPQGRTLADLYFAQGHYSEALEIYDELVTAHPFDAELKGLRRDAEARLLPAGSAPGAGGAEPGLQRRLARIRALKEWLSVVQAG